jgi:hypothetical protein
MCRRMPGMPYQFDSIDEDSVLFELRDFDLNDRTTTTSTATTTPRVTLSSPISDLNTISLPNLRPVSLDHFDC